MRTTSKTVPVGDIEIACTIVGEGTPLVVLHGAIGLGSTYMRALDPWGDEIQLIHYDQRGSGNTPLGDVQRVTFAGGVEDLEGLRRRPGPGSHPGARALGRRLPGCAVRRRAPRDDSGRGAPQPRAAAGAGADGAVREGDVEPSHSG